MAPPEFGNIGERRFGRGVDCSRTPSIASEEIGEPGRRRSGIGGQSISRAGGSHLGRSRARSRRFRRQTASLRDLTSRASSEHRGAGHLVDEAGGAVSIPPALVDSGRGE
jgi:hypothetical protein